MNRLRLITFWLVLALAAGACAESAAQPSQLDDAVGRDLRANSVLPLTCIPSRTDPVGVWIGLRILAVDVADVIITVEVEPTDARFGSHPSGCHDPEIVMPQSMFLLTADDSTILASSASSTGQATSLEFDVADVIARDLTLVVAPTIAYRTGEDLPQTTLFGIVDRFAVAG